MRKASSFAQLIYYYIGTRRRQFARNFLALSSSQNASASLLWSSSFHRQNVVVEWWWWCTRGRVFRAFRSRSSLFDARKLKTISNSLGTHQIVVREETRANRIDRTGRRKAVERTFRRNDERFRRRKKRKAKEEDTEKTTMERALMSRVGSIENERIFLQILKHVDQFATEILERCANGRSKTSNDEFGSYEDIDRVHAARKKRE